METINNEIDPTNEGINSVGGKVLNKSTEGQMNMTALGHHFPECCLIYVQAGGGEEDDRKEAGTGVVIDKHRVLTAGHNVHGKKKVSITFNLTTSATNEIFADRVLIHKTFLRYFKEYDLAIIEFDNEITNNVANLADPDDYFKKQDLAIAGYGDMDEVGLKVASSKNYLSDLTLVSNKELHGKTREREFGYFSEIEFVISPRPCEYDSGAPIYTSSSSDRRLLGIMARKVESVAYGTGYRKNCLKDTICTRTDNLKFNDYVQQ